MIVRPLDSASHVVVAIPRPDSRLPVQVLGSTEPGLRIPDLELPIPDSPHFDAISRPRPIVLALSVQRPKPSALFRLSSVLRSSARPPSTRLSSSKSVPPLSSPEKSPEFAVTSTCSLSF